MAELICLEQHLAGRSWFFEARLWLAFALLLLTSSAVEAVV
jgi:hypothetical protein